MRRVAEKGAGIVTEVLLVLDATTGQNGLVQAREFTDAVEVTGVVLTKLDGSAKGGIVLAIQHELGIPVKLVGLGETASTTWSTSTPTSSWRPCSHDLPARRCRSACSGIGFRARRLVGQASPRRHGAARRLPPASSLVARRRRRRPAARAGARRRAAAPAARACSTASAADRRPTWPTGCASSWPSSPRTWHLPQPAVVGRPAAGSCSAATSPTPPPPPTSSATVAAVARRRRGRQPLTIEWPSSAVPTG